MALVLADRVQQTATAVGTTAFTLTGTVTGFQSFAVIGNGNTTYCSAFDPSGNWEVSICSYSTTGPTLTRTTILSSSNSGSAVTFSGTVNVFVTYPSEKSVNLDSSGNVTALGTISSGTWNGGTIATGYGGTGLTSFSAANNAIYSTSSSALTAGTLPIAAGGTGSTSTTFVNLTTNVTGTLPVANGGTGVTASTGSTTLVLANTPTLTNPTVTNYTESVVAIGTVTTTNTLSLTSGTVQTATLTASTACTFTMPTATAGKSFILLLKQAAATGNGTATFTSVKWGTAGAPTITATAGKMDILSFVSDGTNWYGSIAQGYTP